MNIHILSCVLIIWKKNGIVEKNLQNISELLVNKINILVKYYY